MVSVLVIPYWAITYPPCYVVVHELISLNNNRFYKVLLDYSLFTVIEREMKSFRPLKMVLTIAKRAINERITVM